MILIMVLGSAITQTNCLDSKFQAAQDEFNGFGPLFFNYFKNRLVNGFSS